jgi:hypothetical protein
MNYSQNLRKSAMTKRVILSWGVVGLVCYVVGGVSGYALKSHMIAKDKPKEEIHTNMQIVTKPLVYGLYDNQTFTKEVVIDWGNGDRDFTPLNVPMSEEEQEFVYYLAVGYNIDFTLAMALIQHESSFQADVVSSTQDYGLMQINQINHKYLTETIGVTDFLDPYQNIRAGMFTIRKLFEKYQDTNKVLMAYNMGENGASRLWKKGIFETSYTEKILNIQQQFNEQVQGDVDAGKLEDN